MGSHQSIRKTVTPEIPDKLYFRIGDVARLCEVPAYVLRFWETEFPQLKPNKGGTGQRLYRKRDVEMALRIKSLLYDQGYTIPGARQVFKTDVKAPEAKPAPEVVKAPMLVVAHASGETPTVLSEHRQDAALRGLRAEMATLLDVLSQPAAGAPGNTAGEFQAMALSKMQALRPRLTVEPARSRQMSLDGELF